MKSISITEIKIVDFTSICNCGWENYSPTLESAKDTTKIHLEKYCPRNVGFHDAVKEGEVYIDRNVDSEIDDTFKSIVMR